MNHETQLQNDASATLGLSSTEGASLSDLLSCPFCAHMPDLSEPDTLYPTGVFWVDTNEFGRSYFGRTHVLMKNNPKACWGMHCVENLGGCGAQVTADSKEEAIAKWQRRAI